ncbi:MAG: protein kinase [Pirellulales bacterium]
MDYVCPQCKTAGALDANGSAGSLTCPVCGFSVTTRSLQAAEPGPEGVAVEITQVHRCATPRAADVRPDILAPGMKLARRYEVRRYLGGGGFGHVLEAYDTKLGRRVAIKVPRRDRFSSDLAYRGFYDQFAAEGLKAAQLDHDGIVRVFDVDFDQENGWAFIVMELMEGGTLHQRYEQRRPTLIEAVDIMLAIAQAIGVAHRQDLFHRDLTPRNVFFTAHGTPKVGDFGLALRDDEQEDEAVEIAGTLAFMSPEQLAGERLDGRSDIWSLGAVLYWLLSGRAPLPSPKTRRLIPSTARRVRPLRQIVDVPQALDDIVNRCLAVRPEDRYGAAQDLVAALRSYRHSLRPEDRLAAIAALADAGTTDLLPTPQPSPRPAWRRPWGVDWRLAAVCGLLITAVGGAAVWQGIASDRDESAAAVAPLANVAPVAAPLTGTGSGVEQESALAQPVEELATGGVTFDLFERQPEAIDWSTGVAADRFFFDASRRHLHLNNGPQIGLVALGVTQSDSYQLLISVQKSARAGQCGAFFGSSERRQAATGYREHTFQFLGIKYVPMDRGAEARLTRGLMTVTHKGDGRYATHTQLLTLPGQVRLDPEDPVESIIELTVRHNAVTRIVVGTAGYAQLTDANLSPGVAPPSCRGRLGVYNLQGASDVPRASMRLMHDP